MRSAIKIKVRTDSFRSGYRYYALRKGRELGIVGTIAEDVEAGCITIHAESPDSILKEYINILRTGTPFCKVSGILTIPDRLSHCIYFEILPTGKLKTANNNRTNKIRNFRIGIFGL
ncbi:MAG: acylphosphatase [Bacteroidales bacterium]|nr:acylphosphatase [Bacteroidales bacterium]MBK9358783.1 acylphosphatase [Bacteroidales bacterium]